MDDHPPDPSAPSPPAAVVNEQIWPLERQGHTSTVHLRHDPATGHAEIAVDGFPIEFRTVSRFDGVTQFLFVHWGQTINIRATKSEAGFTYSIEMSIRE